VRRHQDRRGSVLASLGAAEESPAERSGVAVSGDASVFQRCFTAPRTKRLALMKALEIPEALCRTRTDDPFLTMEVLYQLS
jgi:hypothetical protein